MAITDRLNRLNDLLARELQQSTWDGIVELFADWPGNLERDRGLELLHPALERWRQARRPHLAAGPASLVGLWKVCTASHDAGELDDIDDIDYDSLDSILSHQDSTRRSDTWSDASSLHFYLELRADGHFREVDLARYPLRFVAAAVSMEEQETEKASDEPVGIVYADHGFQHIWDERVDADGFVVADHPDGLQVASSMTLIHEYRDYRVEDRIHLEEPARLERRAHLVWDGCYFNDIVLTYELVSRLEHPA